MSSSIQAEDVHPRSNHNNSANSKIPERGAKEADKSRNQRDKLQCPECGAPIRSYFLNPNEKVLMCSRTRCNYPLEEKQLFYNLAKRFEEQVVKRLLQKRIDKKVDA